MHVRQAALTDAAAVQAIYAPFVTDSIVSFEEVAPDAREMARRMTAILPDYPYLVAEADGRVLGYAYAGPHRTRAAYRSSVDVAIYVDPERHRRGVGRLLLSKLLTEAAERGFHAAFAGVALPNDASIGLHEALGFTPVGIYREVGWKFGAWRNVGWWQRLL